MGAGEGQGSEVWATSASQLSPASFTTRHCRPSVPHWMSLLSPCVPSAVTLATAVRAVAMASRPGSSPLPGGAVWLTLLHTRVESGKTAWSAVPRRTTRPVAPGSQAFGRCSSPATFCCPHTVTFLRPHT